MLRKIRRLLTILLIALVVLGLIGLGAFTWFAFWPFEDSVDRVDRLVPGDVDFVMRASWKDLKDTGWIQADVLDDPVLSPGALGRLQGEKGTDSGDESRAVEKALSELTSGIREMEDQINSQIPLGIATFSFEDDVVPGEIVVAGKWCDGLDPHKRPPSWYELLVLTRVSWKPKFFSALRHGFVRKQFGRQLPVEEVADGIYKFTVPGIRVTSERQRTCGRGQVLPPQNIWYGTRVQDVLAFSNSLALMRGVRDLAEFPDSGRAYVNRPHVELDLRPQGISASMDITPLHNYLVRALDMVGSPVTILRRYLTLPSLHRLNGSLLLPSHDQVQAHATIRYQEGLLGRGVRDVYGLEPEPPGSLVANLVPAEDTFGALLLKTSALHLLRGIYEDVLDPGSRRLWRENLRRMGGYEDIDDFFQEFAGKLGDTAGIALARMGDIYDPLEYDGFFTTDPMAHPDPEFPAIAMIVRLRRDTSPAELDAYLAERVPLLGGSPDLEKKDYQGLSYTRVNLQQEAADFALFTPCWILAQDHFIFASNESYFHKILDTVLEPKVHPPLADDPTFRASMDKLPEKVHIALFLDFDKLFRVPERAEPGAEPRGYLYDRRHLWAVRYRDARSAAIATRDALEKEVKARTGRPPTDQQWAEIEAQVDERVASYGDRYLEFEEEYRQALEEFGRLRALGIGIVAEDEHLITDLSVLFQVPKAPKE